ncbi:MAG: hypothetical protein WD294_15670 [Phycisphaeraceae bacterium]
MQPLRFALAAAIGLAIASFAVADDKIETIPLEIGPETTVFEGPLREDGTVDYVAALNDLASEGVTPENNAYVVIAELTEPELWTDDAFRRKRFEMLGVPPPDDDAQYLALQQWSWRADEAAFKQWDQASTGEWVPADFPLVIDWLDEQDAALNRLVAGIQRERYWAPAVTEEERGLVNDVLLPDLARMRQMGISLAIRARHRIHEGQLDAAIDDLLAIKRLSRHVAGPRFVIEDLVGVDMARRTTGAFGELIAHEAFTVGHGKTPGGPRPAARALPLRAKHGCWRACRIPGHAAATHVASLGR